MFDSLPVRLFAPRAKPPDTREKNEAFGSSLLLANTPMSPKIVNGSYAAIFDADEFLAKVYAGIRISVSSTAVASVSSDTLFIFPALAVYSL